MKPPAGRKEAGLEDRCRAAQIMNNLSDVVSRGAVSPWDERIPFITDENFEELIVNEPLTEQEEKDRLWFIVMCVRPRSPPYRSCAPRAPRRVS